MYTAEYDAAVEFPFLIGKVLTPLITHKTSLRYMLFPFLIGKVLTMATPISLRIRPL